MTAGSVNAQNTCYVVADKPGNDDLYSYDMSLTPADAGWETAITGGDTGVVDIESIEFNPADQILYAWNEEDFGSLNTITEVFVSAGTTTGQVCGYQRGAWVCYDGTTGDFGHEALHWDMDGVAINPSSGAYFASARVDDKNSPPETLGLDWLIVTDNTGVADADFFGIDPVNGAIGFVEIQSVTAADGTILHDIDDLTFSPVSGDLLGIANVSGSAGTDTHIVKIDPATGSVTDLGPLDSNVVCNPAVNQSTTLLDVEGLSTSPSGTVYAVSGDDAVDCANTIWEITGPFDGTPLTATELGEMSETDQESVSCNVYVPVRVGDRVWFDPNFNGIQDPLETGVPGVVLYVTNVAGDTLGTTTTTGPNGNYQFEGLVPDPSGYIVIIGAENFLPGAILANSTQTADPGGPAGVSRSFNSDGLPNGNDEDQTLDWGFYVPELPVELASFEGEMTEGSVSLSWSTLSEKNNAGFEIETSIDGAPFRQVGFVSGNGTTTEEQAYSFDFEVSSFSPVNVRLKQVDFDGKFEYSSVLLVDSDIANTFILGEAYPNPFNPQTSIQLSLKTSEHVEARLYDSMGRLVDTMLNGVVAANQAIEIRVDGSSLPSGTYMMLISGETFTATRTLSLLK